MRLALLIAFLAVEQRVRKPMLPPNTFRNREFAAAQVGAFAISASFFAVFLYSTLYLQNVLHLSPIEAGLAYMPGTVLTFIVSGASAQVGERISPRLMVSVGLVLVAAGMLLMTIAGVGSSWTIILPGTIVALIGAGMFNPAISGLALNSLPEQDSGLAAGANDTFRQAGIAVGIAALGALIPAGSGLGLTDPHGYVDGLRTALTVGAGLSIAGAIGVAALLRPRRVARRAQLAAEAA